MPSVITAGELLVEVMRTERDVPFTDVGEFVGPFPSGAPAIFVDAVVRLGRSAGIVGGLGDDGFGQGLLDRLTADGVDTTHVHTTDELSTGVAFVAYFSDGSRRFIFHMDNSAAGIVTAEDIVPEYVADADVVHVNGSSLVMGEGMRAACYEMVELAADRGALVSLDPNLRPDLLRAEESRGIIDPVLDHADIVVPTADELASLTGRDAAAPEAGARDLIDAGAELVAVTQGADGCLLRTAERTVRDPGFDVDVVDPTGAGDAFSAATVVGSLDGLALDELAAFANAAGAHAVTAMGPMEGVAERAAVESLMAARG